MNTRSVVHCNILLVVLAVVSTIVSAHSTDPDLDRFSTSGELSERTVVARRMSSCDRKFAMDQDAALIPQPQLYLFGGAFYGRYDILKHCYAGKNSIAAGYPGVPFSSISAAYVDTWHYKTPQLYLFSGSEYARYDIEKNKYEGKNTIAAGYPGVPFAAIDAAYVDTWHYKSPQLYLFRGAEYARYDIQKNKYEGKNSIEVGYPGVLFASIDAAYVDIWHYKSKP